MRNPLNRQCADAPCPLRHRETIGLEPGSDLAARFEQWLAGLPPKYCDSHRRWPLALDHAASRRESLPSQQPDTGTPLDALTTARHWCDTPGRQLACTAAYEPCPACRMRHAHAPPEFEEVSFDDFQAQTAEQQENLARVREFAAQVTAHHCGFLLLCGFPGNGKTMLAACAIRAIGDTDALYITQGQFTLIHRQSYNTRLHHMVRREFEDGEQPSAPKTIWQMCQKVPLLVLDEIGAKALSPDEVLIVDEVLKHRYDQRKPTVLVTNLALTGTADRPGLKEFLGDALTDRIRHATGAGHFILQFSGDSFRRHGGARSYLAGLPQ